MKKKLKLPLIFLTLSIFMLGALVAVGSVSPRENTVRRARLFGIAQAAETTDADVSYDDKEPEDTAQMDSRQISDESVSKDSAGPDTDREDETVLEDAEKTAKVEYVSADIASESGGEEAQEPLDKYRDILAFNPYVAGWLKIDDSVIDSPVVYTPKSQNYFLHRALDGSEEERGTFFIAVIWRDGYNNTLIYGHNMKDGTGFGSLKAYADEAYGKSHSIIKFDTLYEEREYELAAVFYSQIDEEELETDEDREKADQEIEEESLSNMQDGVSPDELTLKDLDLYEDYGDIDIYRKEKDDDDGRFRYYYYTDLSDRDDFEYFADNVKARALYDTGADIKWGDELLTLSTCSYHVRNGRLIVVARRIR